MNIRCRSNTDFQIDFQKSIINQMTIDFDN